MFNAWTAEELRKLETGGTGGRVSVQDRETEAQERLYHDETGIYVPARCLKACLYKGAQRAGLKRGRGSLVPYLEATVFCSERKLYVYRNGEIMREGDGIQQEIVRRPPRTGGAALVSWPYLNTGWRIPGQFIVVDDRLDEKQIHTALTEAGMLAGLLEGRPEYGRFIVSEWKPEASG